MKTRNILLSLGAAGILAVSIGAYSHVSAQPYGGGWGMMGGGPGYGRMAGGPGGGPEHCPAFGQNGEPGRGPGFGPGRGAGMMGGGMMGPGRGRFGGGWGAGQGDRALNLTVDDVKTRVEQMLSWQGNQRLKVGDVKEKDANTIIADVVTKDNSLVQRFIIDRHSGAFRRDEG